MRLLLIVLFLLAVAMPASAKQLQPKTNNNAHSSDRKARRQITRLYKELKAGHDFGTLARLYSQDYGSYSAGGLLGWQKPHVFVPGYQDAVSHLVKGEFSRPFKTEFGYHIVQLLDQKPDAILTRHILLRVAE